MTHSVLNEAGKFSASIEVSPKQAVERDDIYDLIPNGCRVYVTDLGNVPEEMIIAGNARLAKAGHNPVPHFAARRFASAEAAEARLERLVGEAGVREVLTIAGEAPEPGPISSSLDLMRTGIFDKHGITHIAVAGHPSGAPDITPDAIRSFLMQKHDYAQTSDAQFRIVTQFGFDPKRILDWLGELDSWGNKFPVHVGIAGPAKTTTLMKYAALVGLDNSVQFLKKKGASLLPLLTGYNPDRVVAPLEEAIQKGGAGALAQIHVYPFGGVAKTADWLNSRGSWSAQTQNTDPSPSKTEAAS
ncbi:MAG: methylenetetrahydrofolate reductase [Cohaesibacter sp.]|nr:methylenetetrahydrofolate reductase [Cohaesibacter sp.]MCV6602352.1 methylenetetrahydrofolate reductase [Cohaesibacter sp.]